MDGKITISASTLDEAITKALIELQTTVSIFIMKWYRRRAQVCLASLVRNPVSSVPT